MSSLDVYLWTRLNGINTIFFVISLLAGGFGIWFFIRSISKISWFYSNWSSRDEKDYNKETLRFKRWLKTTLIIFIITVSAQVLIPNREDAATIYVLPKIVNSEIIKQIPDDLDDIYKAGIKGIKKSLKIEEEEE